MVSVGRKVFPEGKGGVRIVFGGSPKTKLENFLYILAEGFCLPARMVKQVYAPGSFILTDACSVEENTVADDQNKECILIKETDSESGTVKEVLIPCHLISKIVEPSRDAYPQKWD